MMESLAVRRRTMQAVKSKDTAPELTIRRLLHGKGYRYRLHRHDLPGCPDLVFPSRKKVVFVHGCFWHGHNCPRGARIPKSNREYWIKKVGKNRARDSKARQELRVNGWKVLSIWECQLKNMSTTVRRLVGFLS